MQPTQDCCVSPAATFRGLRSLVIGACMGVAVSSVLCPQHTFAETLIAAINCGGDPAASYAADRYFSGGTAASNVNAVLISGVADPAPQDVYKTERWGAFAYSVPDLTAGSQYRVRLHLAEIRYIATGARRFTVLINGTPVLADFDIVVASGGPNRAIVREFDAKADANGRIAIQFVPGAADQPKCSGIEILGPPFARPPAVFSPSSFWYVPIAPNTPLHPNSANFIADFVRQTRPNFSSPSINTTRYASPVYIAGGNTPAVRVAQWNGQGKANWTPDPQLDQQWSAVRIPSYAEPAEGGDQEMTVYVPSEDTLYEFWLTRRTAAGQWEASWGGGMKNVSTNPGFWSNPFGGPATGLTYLGGQITAEELQRREITHVMGIALPEVEAFTVFWWPANRSDGFNLNGAPNRIPEGARLRLDPRVNVDSLNLHPVAKTIARAAQKYGFVVWDKAGAVTLRAQNPKSYTQLGLPNPYIALFDGTPDYLILNGFPWDRLQVLGDPDLRATKFETFNGMARTSFTTVGGRPFRVERNGALVGGSWLTVPGANSILGNGGAIEVTDPEPVAGRLQGFYRAVQLP